MSDRRQFFYHTLIFGFGGMLSQLVPLILFPLYTNYLTTAEYGILDVIHRVGYIVNAVLMVNGVRLALFTFYRQAENEDKRRGVAVTISLFVWIATLVAIGCACVLSGAIDVFLKIGDNRLLVLGLASMFLESLVAVPMALFQIRLESVRYVLTNLTMLLLRLGLCIYLVVGLEWGIWGVLLSQFTIGMIFGVALTCREFILRPSWPDWSQIGPVFRFAWPFVPMGILGITCGNLDRFFLLNYGPYRDQGAGLAAVGLYALAFRLVGFAKSFGAGPMQQVWAAKMYDVHKQNDAVHVFGNIALRIVFVQTFLVLGICVFASEAITALCDRSYLDAATIVPLAGICAVIQVFGTQLESIFYITRKTRLKLISISIRLPLAALLMYTFVPRFGIVGAALALTLENFFNCVVIYCITQRLFAVRYPFKRLAILMSLTVLYYYLSTLFGVGVEPNTLSAEALAAMTKMDKLFGAFSRIVFLPIAWKVLCILLWCGTVWISGVLFQDDKEMVLRNLRKILARIPGMKTSP